eukprot:gene32279-39038_t
MSSLAASRADNFYYPPEWRPEMGGISKFQGSKGKNQYEQYGIIRFELPFDAWCLNCKRHMGKGLRFNAKKDKAGKYFSTTIWEFKTKCYSCDQEFVIRTNPQESTYDYVSGLRKHEQDATQHEEDGSIELLSDEVKMKVAADAMFRLERGTESNQVMKTAKRRLEDLEDLQAETYKQDYDMNSLLRSKNRKKRKVDQEGVREGKKKGWAFPLLPPSSKDDEAVAKARFASKTNEMYLVDKLNKVVGVKSPLKLLTHSSVGSASVSVPAGRIKKKEV